MPEIPISVVMTVHNGDRFLREAIDSILGQTCDSFEFIIVNDGSFDGTDRILSDYHDQRIIGIHNEKRQGQTPCLNQALHRARGRYIARQDADDVSLPTRLQKQMEYFSTHPDVLLLGTFVETMTETGDLGETCHAPTLHSAIVNYLVLGNPFFHSSVVFNRKSALALGGYPSRFQYAQDRALWLLLSQKGVTGILPEVLVKVRVHPKQMSLVPELDHVRREEALLLLQRALRHPQASCAAKEQGRRELAHLWLHYARILSDEGQRGSAWKYLLSYSIRFPDVLLTEPSARRKFAGTCLGPGIRSTARALVHYRA